MPDTAQTTETQTAQSTDAASQTAATGAQTGEGNGKQAGDQSSGGQQAGAGQQTAQRVEDLPDWAQKVINDVRKEAGDHRTAKNAAEQRQQETLDNIAKALGLKKDEEVDPAKLQERLSSREAQLDGLRREQAAGKAARKAGADVDALLDSRTFVTKLGDLDIDADTFDKDLSELVKETLEKNPKLKTQAQAAGASGGQFTGGPGERTSKEPKSLTDAVASAYGTR